MSRIDPRTIHTLALVVDEYGAIRKSVEVTYPRRHAPIGDEHAPQRALYAMLTETAVIHLAALEDGYRLHIPSETRAYQLHGLHLSGGILAFDDVDKAVKDASALSYEETPTVGPQKRLIEHVRMRYYDSASFPSPLPFGTAGVRALPYETYLLAFTPGFLAATLNARGGPATAVLSGTPEERVTPAMLREGGYVQVYDSSSWWIPSGRQVLDPTQFYLPTSVVDPFGSSTAIEYDRHALLITCTRDAMDNERRVENDYRTLAPCLITEPNGNRIATRFDEIGVAVASAIMGKEGDTEGDTLDDPTSVVEMDLLRFEATGKPAYIRLRKREMHGDPSTRWQESYAYFSGTGREILRKALAEPGPAPVLDDHGRLVREADGGPRLIEVSPRWVATGRTVFNNKGDVIKQYEPFFSGTHEFEDEDELVEWGVTRIFHHDPVHRLIGTDYPDGTRSRKELTPWLTETWDPSDTVTEPGNAWVAARKPEAVPAPSAAEQRAAALSALHGGTPTVEELDPLGRPFMSFSDLGRGQRLKETLELDIEGNPLRKIDARGNVAEENRFDVAGRRLYQKSNDAGERWMLPDVLGNPFYSWDERRIRRRAVHDALRRPIELWFQEDGAPEVLAERTVYGDAQPDAAANNLRTKVYQQFDGVGLVTNPAYDFKGNLVRSLRRLTEDFTTQPDWSRDPALEAEIFVTATEYDALSRPVLITLSDQSVIRPTYNEAGLLDAVAARIRGEAAWTVFVEDIDYNARGQRERIRYGNGVLTDYTYSPLTSRLVRLKTIRLGDGVVLQDLRFVHDAIGNIVQIDDKVQRTLFHDGQEVEPVTKLVYDAIGRLIAAYGREHAGQNANVQQDQNGFPLQNLPNPNDPQAMRNYAELYTYDGTGNLLAMVHQAGSGSFTRRYEVAAESNRLLSTSMPGDPDSGSYSAKYTHDEHGNITSMPHVSRMFWDAKNQLRAVDLGGGGMVYYSYNAAGERVRKSWEHNGLLEEHLYLGGCEIYRRREGIDRRLAVERGTLHVTDGGQRIAIVETKTVDTNVPAFTPETRTRYQLGNQLGSAMLELDEAGLVISYEEYHPYGTTAYHAAQSGVEVSLKRYRYIGKERDQESGFYYHGARYYAPWLGTWTSPDPAGLVDGPNLYRYCRNNPIGFADRTGTQTVGAEAKLRAAVSDLLGQKEAESRPTKGPPPKAVPLMKAIDDALGTAGGKPPPPPGPSVSEQIQAYAKRLAHPPQPMVSKKAPEAPTVRQGSAEAPAPQMRLADYNDIVSKGRLVPGYGVGAAGAVALGQTDPKKIDAAGGYAATALALGQLSTVTISSARQKESAPKATGASGPNNSSSGVVKGQHSGRTYEPAQAGGAVRVLDYTRVTITQNGIDAVEAHLQRFAPYATKEAQMVSRLRGILSGEISATDSDLRFYTHELRESVRYRTLGYRTGEPASRDAAYDLWNNAHTATLEDYGLKEGPGVLYHPDIK